MNQRKNIINKIDQKSNWILTILGYILIIVVFLNIILHISYWSDIRELLWFCNIASLIAGIGLIIKRTELITPIFISAIPAQFFWILDFFLNIFGIGFGRTQWLFVETNLIIFSISVILHLILIPFSLYGVYKLGFAKKCFLYGGFIFPIFLIQLTFFLSDPLENRNCVFYPCDLNYTSIDDLNEHTFYNTWLYAVYNSIFWFFIWSISYLFSLSTAKYLKIRIIDS